MVFWCHLGNAVEKNGGDPISPLRNWRKDCTACYDNFLISLNTNICLDVLAPHLECLFNP